MDNVFDLNLINIVGPYSVVPQYAVEYGGSLTSKVRDQKLAFGEDLEEANSFLRSISAKGATVQPRLLISYLIRTEWSEMPTSSEARGV